MLSLLDTIKRYLWTIVEIGFLAVLALLLAHLILGPEAGPYVSSVAENVQKFAAAVPTPSLIGLAIVAVLAMLYSRRART